MRFPSQRNLIVMAVLCLLPVVAAGQGTLRGTVTDTLTNDALLGANIFLKGTAIGAVTNREGEFLIKGIPEGEYTVRVSYIGYVAKEFPLNVTKDFSHSLAITLTPDVIEGEEVVITAQARGQVAAINQQISSNTIINVVSEEKIKELPDVNAAESIGRLPGVSILRSGGEASQVVLRGLSEKFSSITVDGVKIPATDPDSRSVDLSTISQSSLAGIELYKALTPDKDADAIAGSINLVTRKAPAERLLRVDARGDYNDLMKSTKQYDFSLRYGERFLEGMVGAQVTGNLERRIRSSERFNIDYKQDSTNYEITDFIVEFNDEIRKRSGVGLLLDIDTPDSGSIRINNIYNRTDRNYTLYGRNYPTDNTLITYSARDREQAINTFTSSIRGDNYLLGLTTNWGLSFAQSKSDYPYDYYLDFFEPSLRSGNTQIAGMRPTPTIRDDPALLTTYAVNNFSVAPLNWAYYRGQKNFDKEKTAFLDLSRSYTIGSSISGEVKIGAKYKDKSRFLERSELLSPYYLGYWEAYTRLPDGSYVKKNFVGTIFEDFYRRSVAVGGSSKDPVASDFFTGSAPFRDLFGTYSLKPLINRDALRLWYELNKNGNDSLGLPPAEYSVNPGVAADYYDILEQVTSGYVMNTLHFGQSITLITGVRAEHENNTYYSRYSPNGISGFPPTGPVLDTSAIHKETVWLPNIQAMIKPNDYMNVRLAAYRALARPDFNYRLRKFVLEGGSGNLTLDLGNPNLRTAKAWNYEINTSFFSNTIGLISVSVFYKNVSDMFHVLNGASVQGDSLINLFGGGWKSPFQSGTAYQLTVPYNSSKPTKVWGIEFEHQINFNFLPGFLQNFVLSYNASFIRSQTYLITTQTSTRYDTVVVPGFPPIVTPFTSIGIVEKRQKLEGQPEFYGNISLGYDIDGLSIRVSLFHQGEFDTSFSATGLTDQVINSFTRWDVAVKYDLTPNLSILGNVSNLTDATDDNTIINRLYDNRRLANTRARYGLTADLGVRLTL